MFIKEKIKKIKNGLAKKSPGFRFIFLPIVILFIISLASAVISFYGSGHYILGGDLYYPLDSQLDMHRIPFAWDIRYATGQTSDGRHIPSFLFFLFFSVSDKLSLSLFASQKIAIFGIFSLTAPAMFYLIFSIYKYQKKEIDARFCFVATIAAFFYNFNLWNLFNWSAPSVHLGLAYLATPLVLALFIRGIENNKYWYVCLIALVSVLFSPSASNPIYILNIFWPVGFFIVFIAIESITKNDWKELRKILTYSLTVFFFFFLINLWWILPMADSLKNSVNDMSNSADFWKWLDQKSARSSFLNIFQLINHEAWSNTTPGSLIISSAHTYVSNIFFILMGFVFPILAFLKLIQKKKDFFVLYFATMAIVMIFLAKGVHEPLGGINEFLHKEFLFLKLYRSVEWYTPMIVLSLAYLVGKGAIFAYDYLRESRGKKRAQYFLAALTLTVLVYGYPFWTGKVVHQGTSTGEIANSYFVKIPAWYFDSAKWINDQKDDFRVFSEPSVTPYYHTDWGFSGGELGIFLFDKPIINNIFGSKNTEGISKAVISFLAGKNDGETMRLSRMLGILNTRYVVLRQDAADWNPKEGRMFEIDDGQIMENLKFQDGLMLKKTIGGLVFFENKEFLPHLYIPQNSIVSQRTIEDLPRIVSSENWQPGSAVFFENQNNDKNNILNELGNNEKSENSPVLEFKGINPTKYKIIIHKASGSFPLIFSEAYHEKWKMYLEKIKGTKNKTEKAVTYNILDGNESDQATRGELVEYVKNGWISSLGCGGNVDFISKNLEGSIQNNNLPDGNIWETWFEKPLDSKNHLMANGYANSWLVDTEDLCFNNPGTCIKNSDGTYDIELIIEFQTQKLFYLGLFISAITLLASLGYLLYNWRKKKI
ncbi:MAG: alpha-(1-_3)-arabinofuranosyltransferase family protein [Parcubacteria group bacterium]|jgi:hypothetical protein